jgi:hypothetical protein
MVFTSDKYLASYARHTPRNVFGLVISVFANLTDNCVESVNYIYEGVSKILQTDAVKIIKLTIGLIDLNHPQSTRCA